MKPRTESTTKATMTANEASDEALMRSLASGEHAALETLMNRWREPLRYFLLRYLGNEADALDLAQESFVRIYLHRADYRPGAKFSTWLFQIALNLARDLNRKKIRRKTDTWEESGLTGADGLAHPGDSPAESARKMEERQAVRRALSELPEAQKALIVLAEYEDLSHTQIADLLGLTAKAVESRLSRVRARLRDRLQPWLLG